MATTPIWNQLSLSDIITVLGSDPLDGSGINGAAVLDFIKSYLKNQYGLDLTIADPTIDATAYILASTQGQETDSEGNPSILPLGAWQSISSVQVADVLTNPLVVPSYKNYDGDFYLATHKTAPNPIYQLHCPLGSYFPRYYRYKVVGKPGFFAPSQLMPGDLFSGILSAYQDIAGFLLSGGQNVLKESDGFASREYNLKEMHTALATFMDNQSGSVFDKYNCLIDYPR